MQSGYSICIDLLIFCTDGGFRFGLLRSRCAGLCALEQQIVLAGVEGERGGAFELSTRFAESAKAKEQFRAHAGEAMIVGERGFSGQVIGQLQANRGTERHGECDGTIELHDRRGLALRECRIDRGDASPVCLFSGTGASVAGGDGGLQRVRAGTAVHIGAELLGAIECSETAVDEQLVPTSAILVEEQDGLAGGTETRGVARGLYLHERDEAVDFRFTGRKLGQDAAKT